MARAVRTRKLSLRIAQLLLLLAALRTGRSASRGPPVTAAAFSPSLLRQGSKVPRLVDVPTEIRATTVLSSTFSNNREHSRFPDSDDCPETVAGAETDAFSQQIPSRSLESRDTEAHVCRIVTRSTRQLPLSPSVLPRQATDTHPGNTTSVLDRFEAYFQARADRQKRSLDYLLEQRETEQNGLVVDGIGIDDSFLVTDDPIYSAGNSTNTNIDIDVNTDPDISANPIPASGESRSDYVDSLNIATIQLQRQEQQQLQRQEERRMVAVTKASLKDAGYRLLSRRDLDLCESLNAGYLLRLSIIPDLRDLDPTLARDFGIRDNDDSNSEVLFDGKVLIYWKGYSQEVTDERLLLPKIDYLQASVVQRSAAWLKARFDAIEERIANFVSSQWKALCRSVYSFCRSNVVPERYQSRFEQLFDPRIDAATPSSKRSGRFLRLDRYGGTRVRFVGSPDPTDALEPFMVDRVTENERQDHRHLCEYDRRMNTSKTAPSNMQLLERISISNLVDIFTSAGRTNLVTKVVSKSKLIEPTYREVVVIWRSNEGRSRLQRTRRRLQRPAPPKFLREFADMFDMERVVKFLDDNERKRRMAELELAQQPQKIQIRTFENVPMANLPAVFPQTKLVFRPADAFLFDLISIVTFVLVASSIRLDNPRLDVLALVSVSLWSVRTFVRYSNKLARYDLLVQTFLTSKISYRDAGALKHIIWEAGTQRAVRVALAHLWLSEYGQPGVTTYDSIVRECADGVNSLLQCDRVVPVDAVKAVQELRDLGLVVFDEETSTLMKVATADERDRILEGAWNSLLTAPYVDDELDEYLKDDGTDDTPDGKVSEGTDGDDDDNGSGDSTTPKTIVEQQKDALEKITSVGADIVGSVLKSASVV